jgi:hypothetical protein
MSRMQIELRGLRFSVPTSWQVEDSGTEVTVRQSDRSGAITISTYRHQDAGYRADALSECKRFLASRSRQDVQVQGSNSAAMAEFTDGEGIRWIVKTLAGANRFALATYNTALPNGSEETEAWAILSNISLSG